MDIGLAHPETTLESRFLELDRPIFLSGIQALVRVLLEQSRLDRAAGHRTAALVSGYRGSPLGGLDRELWRKQALLDAHDIRFQPGVNEDLAATMLFGTQQIRAFPGQKFDGVFGMWYGKGPGVDRAGDALHCANMLGTDKLGGVLAVSGDDHGAHSSTYPHQTEHIFESVMMPVLNPGSVQDIIDFGLAGFALSRFCGLWVAHEDHGRDRRAGRDNPHSRAARIRRPRPRAATPRLQHRPHAALPRRPRRTGTPRGDGAAARRARLGPRQPPGPAGVRDPRRADRPGHRRPRASRHAARTACARPGGASADRAVQSRADLAAGSRGSSKLRPRQARPAGDRGKAQLRRSPDPRRALPPAG